MNFFIKSTACLFIENIFLTKEVYGRKRAYMYQCVRVSEAGSADLLLSVCCDPQYLTSVLLLLFLLFLQKTLSDYSWSGILGKNLKDYVISLSLNSILDTPPQKKIIRKSLKKHNIIGNHIRIDTDKYLMSKGE